MNAFAEWLSRASRRFSFRDYAREQELRGDAVEGQLVIHNDVLEVTEPNDKARRFEATGYGEVHVNVRGKWNDTLILTRIDEPTRKGYTVTVILEKVESE